MESVEDLEGCGDARGKLTKPIIQMPGGRGLSAPPVPQLPAAGRPESGKGGQFRGFRASRRTVGTFVRENRPTSLRNAREEGERLVFLRTWISPQLDFR